MNAPKKDKKTDGCALCGSDLYFKFNRHSPVVNKSYGIYACKSCKLWQINPAPLARDLKTLYEKAYFGKRTKRGYNNYASDAVRKTILSTVEKNLRDLNFYSFEKSISPEPNKKKSFLEIGSAAGYFLEYLQNRGWKAMGIDVSREMTKEARQKGLNAVCGDFLKYDFKKEKFDLIALWATLEHLPNPEDFIRKIATLLKPQGHLYLSTAHTGFWARVYGQNWRYLNVPEHIFYFNKKNLNLLFQKSNLQIQSSFTYGSGFTAKTKSAFTYRFLKFIFDRLARFFHSGDMIVLDVTHRYS